MVAEERDVQGFFFFFFWYIHVALVHWAPAFISSSPSLGPLAPGAEWPMPHVPPGTVGNGIMRKLSVRQREWKRLVPVWLKRLMRYVLGFQSNSKSGIISDQVVTFGCEHTQMAALPFIWNVMGQNSLNNLPGKLFRVYAKHFSKLIFCYTFGVVKDKAGSHLGYTTELEVGGRPKMCTRFCLQPHRRSVLDAERT